MAALLLSVGLRAGDRRIAQRDPARLSIDQRPVTFPDAGQTITISMLQRWERILHLTPPPEQSERDRRAVILGRLSGSTSNRLGAITNAMAAVFGSWFVGVVANHVTDVDYPGRATPGTVQAHWPAPAGGYSSDYPGTADATYAWWTGLDIITVAFTPPPATDPAQIQRLTDQAFTTLDAILPAYMLGTVSQQDPAAPGAGFFLDISTLDNTAL